LTPGTATFNSANPNSGHTQNLKNQKEKSLSTADHPQSRTSAKKRPAMANNARTINLRQSQINFTSKQIPI
jgi:hypothetical protein